MENVHHHHPPLKHLQEPSHNQKPNRIIIVRHGQSLGNLDNRAYSTTPDPDIALTSAGIAEAQNAGVSIRRLIESSAFTASWRVYFYVSPYERARSTLREIGRAFPRRRIIGVREECRIREQDFGNFQVEEDMKVIKETRIKFGRFFYRFPQGESAADVYDRISSFMESLWRDIDMNRLHHDPTQDLTLILVTHGLTSRVFLMKWFKWTVEQYENLKNPANCEYRIMELGVGGEYSLAIHHSEEQMLEWGLSPDMISDQKWRARAKKGDWNENCPWYFDAFFDQLADSSEQSVEDESNHALEDGSSCSTEDCHSNLNSPGCSKQDSGNNFLWLQQWYGKKWLEQWRGRSLR